MAKIKRECRSCRFFGVKPGDRARVGNVYPCTFVVQLPPLPVAVTRRYGRDINAMVLSGNVEPTDGGDCPTYEVKA